jgi:hypothetical protein
MFLLAKSRNISSQVNHFQVILEEYTNGDEYIRINTTYCGVFTPCKNCNFETRSRDYATVGEAVFSPCRAEPRLASLFSKRQL